ncbi:MAG: DUF1707 domain-containing protein [Pseudonocardiaceae bacterium]|nr:DUF1707 domain-containing protein [Pseudonocardiaceae bacterium]
MRVSNADRKAVQDRLHWAHAEGLIDLSEFDARVRSAWDAKTRSELGGVPVVDLGGRAARRGAGSGLRVRHRQAPHRLRLRSCAADPAPGW